MANKLALVEILGDQEALVGSGANGLRIEFSAPDPVGPPALLLFTERGLIEGEPVPIRINGYRVGKIFPYPELSNADRDNAAQHRHTQMCSVPVAALKAKPCVLEIDAPRADPSRERCGDFVLETMCLFYHRAQPEADQEGRAA